MYDNNVMTILNLFKTAIAIYAQLPLLLYYGYITTMWIKDKAAFMFILRYVTKYKYR